MTMSAPKPCPFCQITEPVLRNNLAYAIFDRDPVTPGHMLIIPWRHVADWFDTTSEEQRAMLALANTARALLKREHKPDGFNLGVNCGEAAGQSVFHVHLHLIPRYHGDMDDPLGGVRGVIPARQKY
jgi:diadenosine tetraphosphate (Ap4A) HIT family hydrolase